MNRIERRCTCRRPATPALSLVPRPTALAGVAGSPSSSGALPPMPRTYADLLSEARAQIREVTPQEVDALPAGTAVVDVREDSEWDQGHLPGARPHQQELRRAADRERGPGPRRAGRPVLRRRRPLAVRRPDARAARLHERGLDVRRVPGVEVAGPPWDKPVTLSQEQKQRYSRHLLIPEVGAEGQAKLLGEQGAVHRRRRSRLARPRSISRPPASARSGSSTSTSSTCRTSSARSSTRTSGSASGRSSRRARRSPPSTPT